MDDSCRDMGASDTLVLQLNLTDDKSIKECIRGVIAKFEKIDILINNAGVVVWEPLKNQTYREIESQLRTNLEGLIKMTKEALPHIKEMIVNISSGAGLEGYADLTVYCATKFGVRGFTKSLAEELDSIKIFSVNPGTTKTRMTNFSGLHPSKVAQVILNLAKGEYNLRSGSDVNIWDYVR